ncbi:hypothetical protein FI667_g8724, partial [Globisporangium splendens]
MYNLSDTALNLMKKGKIKKEWGVMIITWHIAISQAAPCGRHTSLASLAAVRTTGSFSLSTTGRFLLAKNSANSLLSIFCDSVKAIPEIFNTTKRVPIFQKQSIPISSFEIRTSNKTYLSGVCVFCTRPYSQPLDETFGTITQPSRPQSETRTQEEEKVALCVCVLLFAFPLHARVLVPVAKSVCRLHFSMWRAMEEQQRQELEDARLEAERAANEFFTDMLLRESLAKMRRRRELEEEEEESTAHQQRQSQAAMHEGASETASVMTATATAQSATFETTNTRKSPSRPFQAQKAAQQSQNRKRSSLESSSESQPTPSSQSQSSPEVGGIQLSLAAMYGDPDVVIHVGACSFAMHLRAVERLSPVFYRKLRALRGQTGPHDSENEDAFVARFRKHTDEQYAMAPSFSLRVVNGSSYANDAGTGAELALSCSPLARRCPLDVSDAATFDDGRSSRKRRKTGSTSVFSFVYCIAHSASRSSVASSTSSSSGSSRGGLRRSSALNDSPDAVASIKQKRGRGAFTTSMVARSLEYASPEAERETRIDDLGKENRDHNQLPVTESHLRRREQQQALVEAQHYRQEQEQEQDEEMKYRELYEEEPCQDQSTAMQEQQLHVELCNADPGAVATLIEFLHTQRVQLVRESNVEQVIQLCRWLSFESDLMYECLGIAIRHVNARDWMELMICCSKLRDWQRKQLFVEQLFDYIRRLTPDDYADVLEHVQMQHLGAIEGQELLGRVVMCFTNHVRHVGVWRNILHSLELWMFWIFKRQFVNQPPLSLLEFHAQYATWEPFVTLPSVEITGERFYVRPMTLFRFGNFCFQVRFEWESLVLIQWRIVKESSSEDLVDGLHRSDPAFVFRGEMVVRFKSSSKSRIQEQKVSLRYTHSVHEYGIWKPLITSSSELATLVSSQEAKSSIGFSESDTASSSEPHSQDDDGILTARFTGRFFVWGHRLCNLYHYLSACTLFYSSPTGSIGDLHPMNVMEKMRHLPVDTLVMVLQSDRLRIPGGETTLVQMLTVLCFQIKYDHHQLDSRADSATNFSAVDNVRALFACVRWCFADLSQIMNTLERSPRECHLYELIEKGLSDPLMRFSRRVPWSERHDPYRTVTTLVEFQIEAGDRSLSPSRFPLDALSELALPQIQS